MPLKSLLALACVATALVGFQPTQLRVATPIPSKEAGVGRVYPFLSGNSLDGKAFRAPVEGAKFTVIALTSTTCPLCMKLAPTLASLEDTYAKRGVKFMFVNPSEGETRAEMKAQVAAKGFDGPYVAGPTIASRLGAKTTTEVFVLDPKGTLVYRGAVDDQYGIGTSLPKPRNHFLVDALDAVLAGKAPKVSATWSPGCLLPSADESSTCEIPLVEDDAPTYHADIEPLVQKSCLPCHRTGGVAPFALDTYTSVKSRATMLSYVVDEGIMPPWFAAKAHPSPWANDSSLTDAEKSKLRAWIKADMPKGRAQDAPKPPTFIDGWTIGKPDAVFQLPESVRIPATGTMDYKDFIVPTEFTEDKWVQKIEVLPGDRRVVHHVLVFLRTPEGRSARVRTPLNVAPEDISGFFGIYVPGCGGLIYADGMAKKVPAGSLLRFQMHYTPNGTATEDRSKIGMVFAKEPPKYEVFTTSLANVFFSIPPKDPNYEIKAELDVPIDAVVLSYLPHMHLRGKAAKYELVDPSGVKKTVLEVPRYDFNWQLNYIYREPLKVKAGSKFIYTAWYDNSDKNPANPNPLRRVHFGKDTTDEMHLGYIEYILPNAAKAEAESQERGRTNTRIEATFRLLDKDNDGHVTEAEAGTLWEQVKAADLDEDGKITLDEAIKAFGG